MVKARLRRQGLLNALIGLLAVARVLVVGGGIAGVAVSTALRAQGIEVLCIDPRTIDGSDDVAPHTRLPHLILPSTAELLEQLFPALIEQLVSAGGFIPHVPEKWRAAHAGSDFPWLYGTRLALDRTWRKRAQLAGWEPQVDRLVSSELMDNGAFSATLARLGTHQFDLAVDASGQRTSLSGIHFDPLVPSRFISFSRWYRSSREHDLSNFNKALSAGGNFDVLDVSLFPAEHRMFSITVFAPGWSKEFRSLSRPSVFESFARRVPGLLTWMNDAAPIGPVQLYAGCENRIQSPYSGDQWSGPIPVGDAMHTTNPMYGRGLMMALSAARSLAEHIAIGGDAGEVADRYLASLAGARDWVFDAAGNDLTRQARWRTALGEAEVDPPPEVLKWADVAIALSAPGINPDLKVAYHAMTVPLQEMRALLSPVENADALYAALRDDYDSSIYAAFREAAGR